MAQQENISYQLRTVKIVRGLEPRTVAKWESQGWELMSQTTGRVSSELVLRRPKPKTPWIPLAALGGVIALLAIVLTVTNLTQSTDSEPVAETTQTPTETPQPTQLSPTIPSTEASTPAPAVTLAAITAESSPDFADLLEQSDYCSPDIASFARTHAGDTLEFDGSVVALGSHNGASTRYDILIAAGDYSETTAKGPAFQYRDVNTTYDLHWSGTAPESIGVGSNLHFTATVEGYEGSSCLLVLRPIATAGR